MPNVTMSRRQRYVASLASISISASASDDAGLTKLHVKFNDAKAAQRFARAAADAGFAVRPPTTGGELDVNYDGGDPAEVKELYALIKKYGGNSRLLPKAASLSLSQVPRRLAFEFSDEVDRELCLAELEFATRKNPPVVRAWEASLAVYPKDQQQAAVAKRLAQKYLGVRASWAMAANNVTLVEVGPKGDGFFAKFKGDWGVGGKEKTITADSIEKLTAVVKREVGKTLSKLQIMGLKAGQTVRASLSLSQDHSLPTSQKTTLGKFSLTLASPRRARALAHSLMQLSGAKVSCDGCNVRCSYPHKSGAQVMSLAHRAHGGGSEQQRQRPAVSATVGDLGVIFKFPVPTPKVDRIIQNSGWVLNKDYRWHDQRTLELSPAAASEMRKSIISHGGKPI